MYIKSLIDITYNDVTKLSGTSTTKIVGKIIDQYWSDNYNKVSFTYQYLKEDGVSVIKEASYFLTGQQIDDLSSQISQSLPAGIPERNLQMTKAYIGFKMLMAQTFNINVSNIEIVNS
jgi:hypothetical protein